MKYYITLFLVMATFSTVLMGGLVYKVNSKDAPQQAAPIATSNLPSTPHDAAHTIYLDTPANAVVTQATPQVPAYPFNNPAGCAASAPLGATSQTMLDGVQLALGDEYNLAERRHTYIWNGDLGSMLDVTQDPFVYEFTFNEFQPPLTYRGDQVATIFLAHGFVVWFREYGDAFRLLAIPLTPGVFESRWAGYAASYWMESGAPNDEFIYPVMKKLPCQWVIAQGYTNAETIQGMFDFDWHIPNYLLAGRQYLASTCQEANQVSREKIGYWDASSMCGPLAWTIMKDVNGFPYRIGSWYATASAFTSVNPKWDGQPWGSFDPETFDLMRTDMPMPGYDFNRYGDLYPGDIVYSFSTLYHEPNSGVFDHIFLVGGVDENGARLAVSNMVRNHPYEDCTIEEITLYTPGNRETGVINHEWNGFGYGKTGFSGFDVFRWKWVTFHINGQAIDHTVRWGETLETIAFDWKIAPERIAEANSLPLTMQLSPGQTLSIPAP